MKEVTDLMKKVETLMLTLKGLMIKKVTFHKDNFPSKIKFKKNSVTKTGRRAVDSLTLREPNTISVGDMLLSRMQYMLLYSKDKSRRHGYNEAGI